MSATTGARMLLIGEVKILDAARFGKALIIKHMPDLKLMVIGDRPDT